MNHHTHELTLVDRARRQFFDDGQAPSSELAPHIGRSWKRCQPMPASQELAEPIGRAELAQRRESAAWLLRCAQPELDGLADHVLGQGCVVILSDASGMILDEIGSPEFLPKAHRVSLEPGVDWSETLRGTNAIGTALYEREALMVLGGEHFLTQNGGLGCAAAPIFTPQGGLAGVLDISGESVHIDAHALGLVRMAASQVEHRLMSSGRGEGQLVRFHGRPSLLGTAREGLLSVVEGEIVGVNRVALELLHGRWNDVLGTPIERIFGARWKRLQDEPGLFAAPTGRQWAVVVEARGNVPRHRPNGLQPGALATLTGEEGSTAPGTAAAAQGTAHPSSRFGAGAEAAAALIGAGSVVSVAQAAPPRHAPAAPAELRSAMPATATVAGSATGPLALLLTRSVRALDQGLPVLVTGETGCGKDYFAKRLHAASRRASGPLVTVNCAALPEALIEAELFGYEEGVFTGARRRGMPGRLREANGGVLFLDEIADMPLLLQSRLLHVLEERVVRPLGSSHDMALDFDLICATHRDLRRSVRDGSFREDLLYRLMGVEAALPALRDRADREALIARLFDEQGGAQKSLRLGHAAREALGRQAWPGNIRQLISVLRLIVALAEPGAEISEADLPANLRAQAGQGLAANEEASPGEGRAHNRHGVPLGASLDAITRDAIQQALAAHGGRVAAAASSLGVHRSTVYRYLAMRKV